MAYVVVARWRANAGSEDGVVAVLEELTAASRAEHGCLGYTPHRSTEDPRRGASRCRSTCCWGA